MSDWYYADNNEQKGPINESELKANLATGALAPTALVWKDGMDAWAPANTVPAFSFRPPPQPAKSQPVVTASSPAALANPASATPVTTADIMGVPEALEVTAEDAEKNKIFGILAYLWILCLVPLLAAKESPYARYHANQGLVLFLAEIVISIVIWILQIIMLTILPGSLGFLVTILSLVQIVPIILIVLGIINAAQGKCVPLPVIGGIKLIK